MTVFCWDSFSLIKYVNYFIITSVKNILYIWRRPSMYTLCSLKYLRTNKACKAIKFMIFYFTYTLKMSWRTISNLITLYSLFHSRFINLYSHQQFEFFRKYRHGNTPHMGCQSYMDFNQLYTLAVWQNLQPPYTPHFVIFQLPGVKST